MSQFHSVSKNIQMRFLFFKLKYANILSSYICSFRLKNHRFLLKRLSGFAPKTSPPGKAAPKTAGILIGQTIINILNENDDFLTKKEE